MTPAVRTIIAHVSPQVTTHDKWTLKERIHGKRIDLDPGITDEVHAAVRYAYAQHEWEVYAMRHGPERYLLFTYPSIWASA